MPSIEILSDFSDSEEEEEKTLDADTLNNRLIPATLDTEVLSMVSAATTDIQAPSVVSAKESRVEKKKKKRKLCFADLQSQGYISPSLRLKASKEEKKQKKMQKKKQKKKRKLNEVYTTAVRQAAEMAGRYDRHQRAMRERWDTVEQHDREIKELKDKLAAQEAEEQAKRKAAGEEEAGGATTPGDETTAAAAEAEPKIVHYLNAPKTWFNNQDAGKKKTSYSTWVTKQQLKAQAKAAGKRTGAAKNDSSQPQTGGGGNCRIINLMKEDDPRDLRRKRDKKLRQVEMALGMSTRKKRGQPKDYMGDMLWQDLKQSGAGQAN